MTQCPQCSRPLATGSDFCPSCGHYLGWDQTMATRPPAPPTSPAPPTEPVITSLPPQEPQGPRPPVREPAEDRPPVTGPSLVCQNCGDVNPATRTYCQRCGERLPTEPAPATPPTGYVPEPHRPQRQFNGKVLLVLLLVLLLAAALILILTMNRSRISGHPTMPVPPTATTPTAPAPDTSSPSLLTTPTPTPSGPGPIPPGYRQVSGPSGFSTIVPDDWLAPRLINQGEYQVDDPRDHGPDNSGRFIRYGATAASGSDMLGDHVLYEQHDFAPGHPGYRRIGLFTAVHHGQPAVDWEFTWIKDGVPRHVHVLYWQVGNTEFNVYTSSTQARWDQTAAIYDAVVAGSTP